MGTRRSLNRVIVVATLAVAMVWVAFLHSSDTLNLSPPPHNADLGLVARLRLELDPSSSSLTLFESELGLSGAFGVAFADDELNVNDQLQLIGLQTPPPGSTAPGGTFTITSTFLNISETTFDNIYFRVAALAYSDQGTPPPELINGDRNGTGVGAEKDAQLPGGALEPGETFSTAFDVQLPRIFPFVFFVDALTLVSSPDETPPTITASVEPSPNAAGWHNTSVVVSFDCADADSGIASCSDPFTSDVEGAGQVVQGTAVDNEGNSATTSVILNIDKTPPNLEVVSPQDGAVVSNPQATLNGIVGDILSGVDSVTCNTVVAQIAGSTFTCDLELAEGLNQISVEATDVAGNVSVLTQEITLDTSDKVPPAAPDLLLPAIAVVLEDFTPTFTWVEVVDPSGVSYQLQVDNDSDFSSPEIDTTTDETSFIVPDFAALQIDQHFWRVRAIDGAGNEGDFSNIRAFTIALPPQAVLVSIEVMPGGAHFSDADLTQQLTVTGTFSNGATQDLTSSGLGTTYLSSNPFVASVGPNGLVTSIDNGQTTISAANSGLSDTAEITVEIGVSLQNLDLAPQVTAFRNQGEAEQLQVVGEYTDGSTRDLTSPSTGTTYKSSNPAVAQVSSNGEVIAQANGDAMITASNSQMTSEAQVSVAIASGTGFLRGEVYDDTKGLPLAGAMVALLQDGGGPLSTPLETTTDERGQYLLPGLEGDALVLIGKAGFTSVERRGFIPTDTAVTLLDARLTPLDSTTTSVTPASARQARNSGETVTIQFPAGSVSQQIQARVTPLSNQGLMGVLPGGWSPIAAVDIQPHSVQLAQAATLRIPNSLNLQSGASITIALYDDAAHQWIALGNATVSSDGAFIESALTRTGQVAILVPDPAPFAPPVPIAGTSLNGVALIPVPSGSTASGEVLPRTSPAGDNARATGKVVLQSASPMPSGTVLQAHVSEQFNLFIGSSVVPTAFTQDLILYTRPRSGIPNTLSTVFPITPSLTFGILQLSLGVVQLDVATPGPNIGGAVVGASGGTVQNASGDVVTIPAGALSEDTIVELFRRDADGLPLVVPSSLELLAALELELREPLSQTALLSIPRPAGVSDDAQIIVAQIISDAAGVRRMKIVGIGDVGADIITAVPAINGTPLDGITGGGLYLVLNPGTPFGFANGVVSAPGGAPPTEFVLVTSDTAPFADVTGADGGYLVAGEAGVTSLVTATDLDTGDFSESAVSIAVQNEVVPLNLTLGLIGPVVVDTTPDDGAVNVLVNTPIRATFSEAIASSSVTTQSVRLEQNGVPVDGVRILSADGLRVSFVPDEQLESLTSYTFVLTDHITDLSGNPLAPFSLSFTTIDTSKPPQPEAGQITAGLPDVDGLTLIIGTLGTAEPETSVTATNLTSQETITVLSKTDGSFRARLPVEIGDELALTFRNLEGSEQTIRIPQLVDPDGTTAFGRGGGFFSDAEGRVGSILPRALAQAAILKLNSLDVSSLPSLSAGFDYLDSFEMEMQGGEFNALQSLELTEGQNRFPPALDTRAPFEVDGDFIVPPNFLVNGNLNFEAEASDGQGFTTSVEAFTTVVAANLITIAVEFASPERFPRVFLSIPEKAQPNQQVQASASAVTARVDFQLPAPAGAGGLMILGRLTELGGIPKLDVVDSLDIVDLNGAQVLVTSSRELPGATQGGQYAVVSSSSGLAFVSGRITGPAAVVSVDGLPFVFEANGPNAAFSVPVFANQPFSISFIDPETGVVRGTATGQAPASGNLDIGEPLGSTAGQLAVSIQPDENSLVNIEDSIDFDFSEEIDPQTINANNIVVTDVAGNRIFGGFELSNEGKRVTFTPLRRWQYGQAIRYGVSTRVLAISGAKLPQTVNGSFTTFKPVQVASADVGDARDVALLGASAIVGTSDGLTSLDLSILVSPIILNALSVNGGVSGVTTLDEVSFDDSNGDPVGGAIGLVASGNASSGGSLAIVDLNDLLNLALLGSAQLQSAGIPRSSAEGANNTALVAVQDVGVQEVNIPQAVPANPANPSGAIGNVFPASGVDGVNDVAVLDDKIVAVGVNGLTILDPETLELIGNVSTEGNAQAVEVLEDFSLDANGDGAIDPISEVFDLAVVANGADGLVQLYDVSDGENPALISLVRLDSEANSVTLSRENRLAYIGAGLSGVAIVDLSGPVSVQPVDFDRNIADDRILGVVNTAGIAQNVALDESRAAAVVADGENGVVVLQINAAMAEFGAILRDPIASIGGDEQPAGDPAQAFLTDDALQVEVNTVIPPFSSLFLRIDETPVAGSPNILSFPDGGVSVPLVGGLNALSVNIDKSQASQGSSAALRVQDALGRTLTSLSLSVVAPDTDDAVLLGLFAEPQLLVIADGEQSGQLSVGGQFSDGRILNLTEGSTGTTYSILNDSVADVDENGNVTALAGGITNVIVSNGEEIAFAAIDVQQEPVLVGIQAVDEHISLVSLGEERQLRVNSVFSDGSFRDVASGFGVTYLSSDGSVATVDANGKLTAQGEGAATITIEFDTTQVETQAFVEFRVTPDLDSIALAPFTETVTTDEASAQVSATVSGMGSLQGLEVTFDVTGVVNGQVVATTDYAGRAIAFIDGLLAPGALNVTASVVDPTDGFTLADSDSLTVQAGSGDIEPNNDTATASRLANGLTVAGSVASSSDALDFYMVETTTDGALTVELLLADGATLTDFAVSVLSSDGIEIGRFFPAEIESSFAQAILAGRNFIAVEALAGAADYELSFSFEQAAVQIDSVNPTSGGPGTLVTIQGSGFSQSLSENIVLFGGAAGKVTLASTGELQAIVPASASDGPIEVIVNAAQTTGPQFATGIATPPPASTSPIDESAIRLDPVSGDLIVVNRLWVTFDPLVDNTEAETTVAAFGGVLAGALPAFNTHIVEFPAITRITDLEAVRSQLEALSNVVDTARNPVLGQNAPIVLDTRDKAGGWPEVPEVQRDVAYELAKIFDAITEVRRTPPFHDSSSLKDVTVGVIDTGFNPALASEFEPGVVQFFDIVCNTNDPNRVSQDCQVSAAANADNNGHGTEVTSIIAARNNNVGMNGVLTGLYQANESASGKVKMLVYRANTDATEILAALNDLRSRGPVDVVNISLFPIVTHGTTAFTRCQNFLNRYLRLLPNTLIVVAAGNEDQDARNDCMASMSLQLRNVLSVGSVAVANLDETGEGTNKRSRFYERGILKGSNFGSAVQMAAPGEDILMATISSVDASGFTGVLNSSGTSFASPMVAGVAAMLQSIRPGARFTPQKLKQLLIDTGDPITNLWNDGLASSVQSSSMTRLNALSAVRAVLPPTDHQAIFVADQEAMDANGNFFGKIIAILIDPLTGKRIAPEVDREVALSIPQHNATFKNPTVVKVSPLGDIAVAVVTSVQPDLGDGLLVIDTKQLTATDFIPLSGAQFPPPPPNPTQTAIANLTAVTMPSNKPGVVFSKDGLLLYVATANSIKIINMEEFKVVNLLKELPARYRGPSSPLDLLLRKSAISNTLVTGVTTDGVNRIGQFFSALDLSPDGKILYAVMDTGLGKDKQPGAVVPINVDLYTDRKPRTPGLQTDLSNYFKFAFGDGTTPVIMQMQTVNGLSGSDEPSAVKASPDGKHVYLLNGGVNFFQGIPPEKLDVAKFINLAGGVMAGAAAVAITGLPGALAGGIVLGLGLDAIVDQLRAELLETLRQGRTLLNAPGFTGVFSARASTLPSGDTQAAGTQEWTFPSSVNFGWGPSPSGGGLIIDQFNNRAVMAKRPYDVSIRHDGNRAIVAMFQTGNFCVLDIEAQKKFEQAPPSGSATPDFAKPANPTFAVQPDDLFQGIVGCTRSLRFDNHLWPSDGTVKVFKEGFDFLSELPSPDESLLFTWDIEYAQNGRWAVASHSGTRVPDTVKATICDFENEVPDCRLPLLDIGFDYTGGTTATGKAGFLDEGVQITVDGQSEFRRFGGALTIIDDESISRDFGRPQDAKGHLKDNDTTGIFKGIERAHYSHFPICGGDRDGGSAQIVPSVCENEPLVHWYDYKTPAAPTEKIRFHRPRGLDVQPFVTFASPRFGDYVNPSTGVHIQWRDNRIVKAGFAFYELNATTGDFVFKGETPEINLSNQQRNSREYKRNFNALYRDATGSTPIDKRVYKVEARICSPNETCKRPQQGQDEPSFSLVSLQVTFDNPRAALSCETPTPITLVGRSNSNFGVLSNNPIEMLHMQGSREVDKDTFGQTQGRTLTYRVVPVNPDDLVRLQSGNFVDLVLHDDNNDLAVVIEGPTQVSQLGTGGFFEIKQVEATSDKPKFAVNDFKVNLRYATARCGIQEKTFTIKVARNSTEALEAIVTTPLKIEACKTSNSDVHDFLVSLRERLTKILGFDPFGAGMLPFTLSNFSRSAAHFPDPETDGPVFWAVDGKRVRVVDSETGVDFALAPASPFQPVNWAFVFGPHNPPEPKFDPRTGRQTNIAQLNAYLAGLQAQGITNIFVTRSEASAVESTHRIQGCPDSNSASMQFVFGVLVQIQEVASQLAP